MKSLKESILANVDTGLKNADDNIKELTSFGGKLELKEIFGHDEAALYGLKSTVSTVVSDLKPYSKNIDDIIDRFAQRYSMGRMSNRTRKNIESFITYLENFRLNDKNINFDDAKTKVAFLADLTSMMHADGILHSNAKVHYETSFGGDKKGIFKVSLNFKFQDLTFLYEIK